MSYRVVSKTKLKMYKSSGVYIPCITQRLSKRCKCPNMLLLLPAYNFPNQMRHPMHMLASRLADHLGVEERTSKENQESNLYR
jgi:hypothetical protein